MLGALAKVEGYFSSWSFPYKKSLLLVHAVGNTLTGVQFCNKIMKTRIKKGIKNRPRVRFCLYKLAALSWLQQSCASLY